MNQDTMNGLTQAVTTLVASQSRTSFTSGHKVKEPKTYDEDEVKKLAHQLQQYRLDEAAEWICPRIANRVVKCMVLLMLEAVINRVMCDLAKILRARPDDNLI
jgi:hypothetical protein